MLDESRRRRRVTPPADQPPVLMVVVDTEEEFDWDRPLARENVGVETIAGQPKAHAVFDRHGVVPTYVIDYPVASTPSSIEVLGRLREQGRCEIGAHLHPWVNPPHDEAVTPRNSFPGNLPREMEAEKLRLLTETIEANFGARPTVYKAGRYGVGPNTAAILEDLGYRVDLSVVPHTDFRTSEGPDFTAFDNHLYWFGDRREMLEIPLTCGFAGRLAGWGPRLYPLAATGLPLKLRAPGILARLGLVERIRLTPEGIDFAAQRRLIDALLAAGQRAFSVAYHSPSLVPGHTPYVRDEAGLSAFLKSLDDLFDYFFGERGGRPTTPSQMFAALNHHDR